MNRDDLLLELARKMRDDQKSADHHCQRWERLAAGELSPAEEAELLRESESDPEVSVLYEAYRPVSPTTKNAIFEQALLSRKSASAATANTPVRRLPWRRVVAVALPLAAAASLLVWVTRPVPERLAMVEPTVPDYRLSTSGGDRTERLASAPSTGPVALQRDSKLEFVLRPATPAVGPVTVRAFLVEGGTARVWTPRMERSTDGAIRITGKAADLLGSSLSTWDVAFAVGTAASVPEDPNVIARELASGGGPRPYQLLVKRVQVVDAM